MLKIKPMGRGHLSHEMTKSLLQLLLKVQIFWMLQNNPHQHVIRIVLHVLPHQRHEEARDPMLHFVNAA